MKNFTKLITLMFALIGLTATAQNARVQVIHNCADAAADEVDVYLDGTILLNDFAFRTATPFIDAPAETEIEIVVAPSTSTSDADGIYTLSTTLTEGETYILVANGIVSETGYSPAQPFELSVYAMGRENASAGTNTDVLAFHGATDAPTVDVTALGAGTVVDDIMYGDFNGNYLELPTDDYILSVTTADGSTTVASYQAPLSTLNLEGAAITVLASGFLDPSMNSEGPAFGLWAATASGGPLVELPTAELTARVQVIHNSADLAAQTVDVYLNGEILQDDFAFRTATPFIDAPANEEISIDIAPSTSTSASESIYNLTTTLDVNETYIVIANGIVSDSGYTPDEPFGLYVYAMGREMATDGSNTDVLVFHGATDAPTVDVVESSVPAGTVVDDIMYGNFDGYLELATADYTLDVTTADGNTVVARYDAPLATLNLEGAAITVLASGFLDPTMNSNGPAFGLWAATANGGALVELPSVPLSATEFDTNELVIYPNPASSQITISNTLGADVNYTIYDMSGRNVMNAATANTINVSGLQNGMYMLDLEVNGTKSQHKIVIKK
ncbi:hypothetical protein GCM10007424_01700 [Flavobacterium suaedae]|uniref:DUF4397 domain-containing protein n=1 Tax=Flavobacterium suaedae TaxID=1767027 RepID=A0ABQ1JCI2_9FLAO|nr:DUF4397 domain-containing protein [Flavobacterium suaedae]GGB65422.1 hypothetical protein GCM10007424_01700 [Flavobacterium suaedae]